MVLNPPLTPQVLRSTSFTATPSWESRGDKDGLEKESPREYPDGCPGVDAKRRGNCSVWIMSWEQAHPQRAGCSSLLGKETTFSPSSMQEGPAAPWEPGAGSHPAQLALGTGNEQGKFHLQLRKKLHPKTLFSCSVL